LDAYFKREDVLGKVVIDSEGKRSGSVKDVAFSVGGEIALLVEGEEEEVVVPLDRVSAIGDFVLLKPKAVSAESKGAEKRPGAVVCPTCGLENKPGIKFCVKCGSRIA
jgi:sporulation protein YlmC with PRC-barrel domain